MTRIAGCTDNPEADGVGALNFDADLTQVWMGPVAVVADVGGRVTLTIPGNPAGRLGLGVLHHPDGRVIDLSDLARRLGPLPRGTRISLDGALTA